MEPLKRQSSQSGLSGPDGKSLPKKSRLLEKVVFVVTISCVVFLSHATLWLQWTLPYFYVIVTPILIGVRVVMYWRNRWQYFLLDFCYYVNAALMVFMVIPAHQYLFTVVFALANGPIIWAIVTYRNSLVLHSIDKVTSSYIHILPPLVTFVVRWYPDMTSLHWFRPFVPTQAEFSLIWLYVVPFGFFVLHSAAYSLIVNFLIKPPEDYISSFGYLGDKEGGCLHCLFNCCGPKYRCGMFYAWNWVFCLVSLLGSPLCYYFYEANCAVVLLLCLWATWNGASYYTDVFSVRGFVEEIE